MTETPSDGAAWGTHPWVSEGQGSVRFGIAYGSLADWATIRDFVQTVEGLGFDSYWYCDHPIIGPDCWTLLAESRAAAEAKLATVDPMLTSLLGDSIVAMTPDEAITYYRGLVAAGVQYFIPAVNGFDEETLRLLAEEVIPAVQPG